MAIAFVVYLVTWEVNFPQSTKFRIHFFFFIKFRKGILCLAENNLKLPFVCKKKTASVHN